MVSCRGRSFVSRLSGHPRARTQLYVVAYREVVTAFDARPDQPAIRTIGVAVSADYFDEMGSRRCHIAGMNHLARYASSASTLRPAERYAM